MTRVICIYDTVPRASFMIFFDCFCVIISAINNGVWLVFQTFLRDKLIGYLMDNIYTFRPKVYIIFGLNQWLENTG